MNKILNLIPSTFRQVSKYAGLLKYSERSVLSSNIKACMGTFSAQDNVNKYETNMKSFLMLMNELEIRSISSISTIQKKLSNMIQENNGKKSVYPRINHDINELMALSCTDADIDFLIDITREHALLFNEKHKINHGKHLISLIVSLKKTEKLIELVKNKKNSILLRNHSATEIMLEYLMKEKLYTEINEVLVHRLPRYYRIINANSEKERTKISQIPYSHMEIYTKSLILQGSEKSYFMFKDFVDYIYKNGGQVSKHTILRLLYFSILTKDYKFSFEIINTNLFKNDDALNKNLSIMINSRANKKSMVLDKLRDVFNNKITIYPFTFEIIRDDLKRYKLDTEYQNNIDFAYKRAIRNNLISSKDLSDIALGTPSESPEIFELVENESEIIDSTVNEE